MIDTPSLIAADAVIALVRTANAAKKASADIADPLAVCSLVDIATALHSVGDALTARLRAFALAQGQLDRSAKTDGEDSERAAVILWLRQRSTVAAANVSSTSGRFHRRDLETAALTFASAADAIEDGAHLDKA